MSFIQSSAIPTFTDMLYDVWFRIPQASFDACKTAGATVTSENSPLRNTIPLMIMGKKGFGSPPTMQQKQRVPTSTSSGDAATGFSTVFTITSVGVLDHSTIPVTATVDTNLSVTYQPIPPSTTYADIEVTVGAGDPNPTDPSYIGVDCSGDTPSLIVNLETAQKGELSNYAFNETFTLTGSTSSTSSDTFPQGTINESWLAPNFGLLIDVIPGTLIRTGTLTNQPMGHGTSQGSKSVFEDISDLFGSSGAIVSDRVPLIVNHWHHLLISVRIRSVSSHGGTGNPGDNVSAASLLYVALNDVNYTKGDLSSNWPDGYSDPNGIVTRDAYNIASIPPGQDGSVPSYALNDPSIPAGGALFGIPGTSEYIDNIYRIEMARPRMWLGVAPNTASEAVRRAFITKDGEPEKAKAAEDMFGPPTVSFNKATNIIIGESSEGLLFEVVAKTKKYKPKPTLNGPQGD